MCPAVAVLTCDLGDQVKGFGGTIAGKRTLTLGDVCEKLSKFLPAAGDFIDLCLLRIKQKRHSLVSGKARKHGCAVIGVSEDSAPMMLGKAEIKLGQVTFTKGKSGSAKRPTPCDGAGSNRSEGSFGNIQEYEAFQLILRLCEYPILTMTINLLPKGFEVQLF